MASFYLIHTSTGRAPDPETLDDLCDGHLAADLGACGVDTRALYEVRTTRPVPFRPVRPEHGRFPATLYAGPTRRERIKRWWRAHCRALFWLLVPWLSALAFIVALELLVAGANALADWLSALWP